jgi:hypothetical protein
MLEHRRTYAASYAQAYVQGRTVGVSFHAQEFGRDPLRTFCRPQQGEYYQKPRSSAGRVKDRRKPSAAQVLRSAASYPAADHKGSCA